jgi:hypothetical protein
MHKNEKKIQDYMKMCFLLFIEIKIKEVLAYKIMGKI